MGRDNRCVYHYILTAVKGILLWLAIFIPSSIIGALTILLSRNAILSAILTQLSFLTLSIVFTRLVLRYSYEFVGFRRTGIILMLEVFITALAISSVIAYLEFYIMKPIGFKPPIPGIMENIVIYVLSALILSPICEETLFRGVLLNYMLDRGLDLWTSTIISAILFSLVHLIPFSTTPIAQRISITTTAFIMSIIAGYLSGKTKSIIPAVITHSSFNLGGFIISFIYT